MGETILIVDDEERMRSLIGLYLKREGYNIIEAENGEQALKIFAANKVHLVVLDVMMPVMDGWTTCSELRKKSDVPILMLTAKGEDDDKLLGFQLGTDNYETKPFSPKVLVAKINALIKRVYFTKVDNLRDNFDGLTVDEEAHIVTIDKNEIYLSPKEFELLTYFIRNKDISLSREKILNAVWGMDYFGDLRTVDTHIKRLREKLGDKAYLISTVRGSGYKFEVKR
ncbi:response regulator transcription factor [Clostridium sp. JN-9]|uniref:response regulator transcription factor n=1 Tax=Clostridium sp. JN-9 TaxID=2507159 RepID=UPI000FFE2392|nr:response regulator transcription factor [Clostridium sp. JN-9]QAT41280.1 response regulator transcription factor [Clostridium sp. JN-9]